MSARGGAGVRAARAEGRVREALRLWDAVDLDRSAACRQLLQLAVRDLEALQPEIDRAAGSDQTVRKHLTRIRADVRRMARLVDSSTAFCRRMALLVGAPGGASSTQAPPGYEGQA